MHQTVPVSHRRSVVSGSVARMIPGLCQNGIDRVFDSRFRWRVRASPQRRARQPQIPSLIHSRLPRDVSTGHDRKHFKSYPTGVFYIDVTKLQGAEGTLISWVGASVPP